MCFSCFQILATLHAACEWQASPWCCVQENSAVESPEHITTWFRLQFTFQSCEIKGKPFCWFYNRVVCSVVVSVNSSERLLCSECSQCFPGLSIGAWGGFWWGLLCSVSSALVNHLLSLYSAPKESPQAHVSVQWMHRCFSESCKFRRPYQWELFCSFLNDNVKLLHRHVNAVWIKWHGHIIVLEGILWLPESPNTFYYFRYF